jgi:hypothetical protein
MLIEKCYCCNSESITEILDYEDWDDSLDTEVIRNGVLCNNCNVFHYEENDRIVCIMPQLQTSQSTLKGYIPEI